MENTKKNFQCINEQQAARFLGVSVHTLRRWRHLGKGPRYVKIRGGERPGRGHTGRVLYRECDLITFSEDQLVETTNR